MVPVPLGGTTPTSQILERKTVRGGGMAVPHQDQTDIVSTARWIMLFFMIPGSVSHTQKKKKVITVADIKVCF